MFVGALVVDYIKPGKLIKFTLMLSGFLFAVGTALRAVGKGMSKLEKTATKFLLIVGTCSLILAAATILFDKYPDTFWNVTQFTAALAILMGGTGLVLWGLSKKRREILLGTQAMAYMELGISGAAVMMGLIGAVMAKYKAEDIALGVGIIAAITLAYVLAATPLAAAMDAGVIEAAALAFLCIAGSVAAMGLAIGIIAWSMEKLATVPAIKGDVISNNISQMVQIGWALAPLGLVSPLIAAAAVSMLAIAKLISDLSEAVKEAADLNISVYEGTKKIGYRKLTQSDFKNAAQNVKTIVTVLGQAIADAATAHPELYSAGAIGDFLGMDTPFTRCVKSNIELSKLISKIAEGVKDYADMRVAIKWDKDGKAVDFRHLTDEDFNAAAKNVTMIISILGGAIVGAYNAHPDYYTAGGFGDFLQMDTPFTRCIKSNERLGKLISKIAEGVKDYADMRVAIKWNKDGKAVDFRHLTDNDFKNAAKNVKMIMSTLGGAIIKVYEEHPDYYTAGGFGDFLGCDSPFTRTIKANMELGKLISKIAEGVKDYADLKIGVPPYNKDGKPKDYKHLTEKDFKEAAKNVKYIMTTLGGVIIELYEDDKYDMYGSAWGDFWGCDNAFTRVVKANMQLGELISKIADSVKDYADLKIPIDWDKDGKAIKYRHLTPDDFTAASTAVQNVIETLGSAIDKHYHDHEKWYEEDEEDNPLFRCINGCTKMGEMIGNISEGMSNYADLRFPDQWNKDGKPIHYTQLGPDDFKNAATGVQNVIEVLGAALEAEGKKHPDWYKPIDKDHPENSQNPLATIIEGVKGMGEIISNIAEGVEDFATGTIPKIGNTPARHLTDSDYTKAADTIKTVISTMGDALGEFYNEHKDDGWFDLPKKKSGGFLGFGATEQIDENAKSPMQVVVESVEGIGEIIGSIANAVLIFASGSVPAIGKEPARHLSQSDFDNAANWVSSCISTFGKGLLNLTTDPKTKEMFSMETIEATKNISSTNGALQQNTANNGAPKNKIQMVLQSLQGMGELIGSIANAINVFAQGKIPAIGNEPEKPLSQNVFDSAANAISTILTTVGETVVKVAGMPLFDSERTKAAAAAITQVGSIVTNVAEAVVTLASGSVPLEYNDKGQVTKVKAIGDAEIKQAGEQIKSVMTAIGQSLVDVVSENKEMFNVATLTSVQDINEDGTFTDTKTHNVTQTQGSAANTPIMVAATAIGTLSQIVVNAADAVEKFATMQMPDKWNNDGVAIHFHELSPTAITTAKDNIKNVLTAIGDAIIQTYKSSPEIFGAETLGISFAFGDQGGEAKLQTGKMIDNAATNCPAAVVAGVMGKLVDIVTASADAVEKFATMQMPDKWDANGNPTHYHELNPTAITTAIANIQSILQAIGTAIVNVYQADTAFWDGSANNTGNSAATIISKALSSMCDVIAKSSETLEQFSTKFQNLDLAKGTALDDMVADLGHMLNGTAQIGALLSYNNTPNSLTELYWIYPDWKLNNDSFYSICGLMSTNQNQITKGMDSFAVIMQFLTANISKAYDFYKKSKKDIEAFVDPKNKVAANLVGAIEVVLSVVDTLLGNEDAHSTGWSWLDSALDDLFGGQKPQTLLNLNMLADNASDYIKSINSAFSIMYCIINNTIGVSQKATIASKYELGNMMSGIVSEFVYAMFNPYSNDNAILGENMWNIVQEMQQYKNVWMSGITGAFELLDNFVIGVLTVGPALEAASAYPLGELGVPLITGFKECIAAFQQGFNDDEEGAVFGNLFEDDSFGLPPIEDFMSLSVKVSIFSASVKLIADTAANIQPSAGTGFEIVAKGIATINEVMKSVVNVRTFAQQTNILDKYVKVINSLKILNIDKLNKFVDSLNKLANKLGNIDNLTKVLSEKLAKVLDDLVRRLEHAERTIKEADILQKRRHDLINKSVAEVKTIMSNAINVTVTQAITDSAGQVADTPTDSTPKTDSSTPGSVSSGGSSGGSNSSSSGPKYTATSGGSSGGSGGSITSQIIAALNAVTVKTRSS